MESTPTVAATPEERAVDYLAGEVSRWKPENGCYSCHNNGDAVRAVMTAQRQSIEVRGQPLADTLRFLAAPERWDANNKGDPAFSDRELARIQFTSALVTASEFGFVRDRAAVGRAARVLAASQQADGSWRAGPQGTVGSPATYGDSLATHTALRALRYADSGHYRVQIEEAESWLREQRVTNVLDAAAVLLALGRKQAPEAVAQSDRCLDLLCRAQSEDGGWGPFGDSPPEVFDTAVALLALSGLKAAPEITERIARGRGFLLATQETGGGWPETTRPSGSESYAQHISTTGWAALALLATRESE